MKRDQIIVIVIIFIFWYAVEPFLKKMIDDSNAIIRFIGFAVGLILLVVTVLFCLSYFHGIRFFP